MIAGGSGCGGGLGGIGGLLSAGSPVPGPLGIILNLIQTFRVPSPIDNEVLGPVLPEAKNGIIFDQPLGRPIVLTAVGELPDAPGTGASNSADGMIYYTERVTGRVRKFNPNTNTLDPTPVLDLAVNSSGQRGLIGICFTGDGSQIFLTYCASTTASDTQTQPEGLEFRVSTYPFQNGLPLGAETVLATAPCRDPNFPSDLHSIGPCLIGPDSRLYWSCGDLDNRFLAQNPFTNDMAGKINRINIDGSIPSENPFGGDFYTWALGLRDPRAFTFDAADGKFYVVDSGNFLSDEINDGYQGANFGWPLMQGGAQTDFESQLSGITFGVFITPLVDFGYSRVTPTGIAVIRNGNYGDDLIGNVFLAQAATQARVVRWAGLGGIIVTRSELAYAAFESGEITSMFLGQDGLLYILTHKHLYRLHVA